MSPGANAAVATGICALLFGLVLGVMSIPAAPPQEYHPCIETPSIQFNTTTYWSCAATFSSGAGLNAPLPGIAHVYLRGVAFDVSAYATIECVIVGVSGHELGGPTYNLVFSPSPNTCRLLHPTLFSPDGDFGATWTGGPTIDLYVRAASPS